MTKAKMIKNMVKAKKESVMGKLGDAPYEDPMEPWSSKYSAPVKNEEVEEVNEGLADDFAKLAKEKGYNARVVSSTQKKRETETLLKKRAEKAKANPPKPAPAQPEKHPLGGYDPVSHRSYSEEVENLEEDSWLFSYIRSLGYNPKIMNFAQRSKYARSNAFKHWKQSHMERRPGQTAAMEEVEHVDEMDKSQPSSSRGAEGLPLGKKADPVKTDKVKKDALKTLEKSYKKVKEEVETLDEAGTGLLMTYIKAKGLNPLTMDGNQRQAYSRSSEFKVFKQKHAKVRKEEFERLVNTYGADNLAEIVMQIQETSGMGERGDDWNEETGKETPPFDKPYKKIKGDVTDKSGAKHTPQSRVRHLARLGADKKTVKEEADKADTVTMDIPLLIRVLEYAREDAKTDMDLHKVVENLIKMRDSGTLSMAEYDEIVSIKEAIEHIQELKKMPDNMDYDDHITREDLRQWFSKTHPEGGWKRINSKGEAIGPCAREPGEPKPKCMSNEKRAKLSKKERAAAVAAKRKYDPVADRAGKGGKPVNVSNFGKGKLNEAFELLENHIAIAMGKMLDDEGSMTLGQLEQMERALEMIRAYVDKEYDKQLPAWVQAKITLATDYIDTVGNYLSNKNEKVDEASSPAQQAAIAIAMKKAGKKPKNEEVEQIDEKNSPTNPKLWSRAKAMARSKFDVYPSAYANGWASKWYKSKGGGWKSVKEDVVQEGIGNVEDSPMSATNSVKAMESAHRSKQMKSARMIKSLYKNKIKETTYDWEKDDKPNAKIVVKGGTTMTGQPRDTVEIEPVLRTRPNQVKPTV